VEDVPAHGRRVGLDDLPTQTCDSMNKFLFLHLLSEKVNRKYDTRNHEIFA